MPTRESVAQDERAMEFVRRAALAGDPQAVARLLAYLRPVIVNRVLRAARHTRTRHIAPAEREDLTQDIYLWLLSRRLQVIRTWRPGAGMSLKNYVGLAVERRVRALLRVRIRDFHELNDATPGALVDATPERHVIARCTVHQLATRMRGSLSALGMRVFALVYLEDCGTDSAAIRLSMSVDAIYAWKSRIRRVLQEV